MGKLISGIGSSGILLLGAGCLGGNNARLVLLYVVCNIGEYPYL